MSKLPISAQNNGDVFLSHECFQQPVTKAKWHRRVGAY